MAQKGGRYGVSSGAHSIFAVFVPLSLTPGNLTLLEAETFSSSPKVDQKDEKTDGDWELVTGPESPQGHKHTVRTSARLDVGIGKWAWNVFSWDTRTEHSRARRECNR